MSHGQSSKTKQDRAAVNSNRNEVSEMKVRVVRTP